MDSTLSYLVLIAAVVVGLIFLISKILKVRRTWTETRKRNEDLQEMFDGLKKKREGEWDEIIQKVRSSKAFKCGN